MKNPLIALLVLAALTLCMLAACGKEDSKFLTPEEAQKIAMDAAGVCAKDVTDVHAHPGSYEDAPCFSIHLTVDGTEYEYIIDAVTGEILEKD